MTIVAKSDPKHVVPVIVHAPLRTDAALMTEVLTQQAHATTATSDPAEIVRLLRDNVGILVCTQEGFTYGLRDALVEVVQSQPPWAQLPIVLILDGQHDAAQILGEMKDLVVDANLVVLHRPLRPLEFTTAVSNAVLSRRRQLQIRDHLDYQAELQRELNHRVKNTLSTFLAIFRMSYRQSQDLKEFSDRFTNRMAALTSVHDLLHDTRDGERSVQEIAEAVLSPLVGDEQERVQISGVPCEIGREAALSIGLILNELATNALKYGALSDSRGRIRLSWSIDDETMALTWKETGGPRVSVPKNRGYGTRFIEVSVASLEGTTDMNFEPEGFCFAMTAPIAALKSQSFGRELSSISGC